MDHAESPDHTQSDQLANGRVHTCAVGKVDLRGRFVLADEACEALLGYSQDELFGRPLTEFVIEPDQATVEALLVQYSQYEPVHQTATVSLIPAGGDSIPVTIVTALNFVAGNAVNFQVILTPCEAAASTSSPAVAGTGPGQTEVIGEFFDAATARDWPTLVTLLAQIAASDECLFYQVHNESLDLITTSADPSANAEPVSTAGEPNDLHWWVANAKEAYRFDNASDVQSALQAVATAPTELLIPFVDSTSDGLLRFVYSDDSETESPRRARAMDRIERIIASLQPAQEATTKSDEPVPGPDLPALWPTVTEHLEQLLADSVSIAQPLAHRLADKVSGKDRIGLARLQAELIRAHDAIRLLKSADSAASSGKRGKVDLNLTAATVFERLQPELPAQTNLLTGDLFVIKSYPEAVEQALVGLLRLLMAARRDVIQEIKIGAVKSEETTAIQATVVCNEVARAACSDEEQELLSGRRLARGRVLADQLQFHSALKRLAASVEIPDDLTAPVVISIPNK